MSRTIFVGNLPEDTRQSEVEDLFAKYGRIVDVDLKLPSRPPAFAFVEFESGRDAEDAVRGRDGSEFGGNTLRVEIAHGGGRRGKAPGGGSFGGISRRSDFRVMITSLPRDASWQTLKDTFRRAGEVTFAQVFRDRESVYGVVDYANESDMKYAIRKLDDTEFRSPLDRTYIRVKADRGGERSRSRDRDRGRRRSRSESRSRSPRKGRSPSASASPASDRGKRKRRGTSSSRSPSRSPSPKRDKVSRHSRHDSKLKSKRERSDSRSPAPLSKSRSRSRSPARGKSGDRKATNGKDASPESDRGKGRSRSKSPELRKVGSDDDGDKNGKDSPRRSRSAS